VAVAAKTTEFPEVQSSTLEVGCSKFVFLLFSACPPISAFQRFRFQLFLAGV
jgi:hypothetical protein